MSNREHNVPLDTSHLDQRLGERSVRGGAAMLGAQVVMQVLAVGSTMIMARILTPGDYGLLAMVTSVTGFAGIFKDLGLSMSTIQRRTITHAQVSTLFWINVAMGLLLTVIVAASGPLIAAFFRRPELTGIAAALSLTFLFAGLTAQHGAILRRQMRFGAVAVLDVGSAASGMAAGIGGALLGWGYWALVASSLANAGASLVGSWTVSGWRPGLPRRGVGVRSMLSLGANFTGFNVVNYFARNGDNILIGRYWGSEALGFYSKAYQLLMLPITMLRSPITSVAMPAMSRLAHNPQRYRDYYLKMTGGIAFFSMPLVAVLFVCSDSLIEVVMGSQWRAASPIFRILAVAAFVQPFSTTRGLTLVSRGQGGRLLRFGVGYSLAQCTSFAIGVPWGPIGVATAYVTMDLLLVYPTYRYVLAGSGVDALDVLRSVWRPALTSLMMGACILPLYALLDLPHIARISVTGIVAVGLYCVITSLIPGGSADMREHSNRICRVCRYQKPALQ